MAYSSICSVMIMFLFLSSGSTGKLVHGSESTGRVVHATEKTWCVAKPNADKTNLKNNIEFACSKANCSPIDQGGACYDPDNYVSQASFVMNLYYQAAGGGSWDCDFGGTSLITTTDPSYGSCHYV